MKIVITGNPKKGLGKFIGKHFIDHGHDVSYVGKMAKEEAAAKIKGCDLFINNAYGPRGYQAELLALVKDTVKYSITIGSMASIFPDPKNAAYTYDKRLLQNVFYNKCSVVSKKGPKHLLLSISGSSYKEKQTILKTMDFWLENPIFNEVKFSEVKR